MSSYPTDEQIEALFRGDDPDTPDLASVAAFVEGFRLVGTRPTSDEVAAGHVASMAKAAAHSPAPEAVAARPAAVAGGRTKRRFVVSSILSTALGKVLAASVAVAAVGGGVAVVADGSAPGDAMYGIDRAAEKAGIGAGGATERLEEARRLVDTDLPRAVSTAGDVAQESGDESGAEALRAAADHLRDLEGEVGSLTREQVVAILDLLAEQVAGDGVAGEDVAAAAEEIVNPVELPEEVPVPVTPGEDADEVVTDPPPEMEQAPATTLPDEAGGSDAGGDLPEESGSGQSPPAGRP